MYEMLAWPRQGVRSALPQNNEMQLTVGAEEARPEWGSPCGEPKLSPSERRQEAPPAADLGVGRTE
jgi:hypothetical protein